MGRWTIPSVFLTLSVLCCCNGQFVVVAPNLVRSDSEEYVFLQSPKLDHSILVTIKFTDFNTEETLTQHYATLSQNNDYHMLVPIQVPFQKKRAEKQHQYVNMEVKFGDLHTERRAIMVSFHAGYIFVQTDKPLYKPEDTVQIRLYVSSPTFKTSDSHAVSMDIKNPEGVVIDHQLNRRSQKGIYATKYTLPKIANEGKWTVFARFDHWPQNNFNTTFEVKKYVLPAFSVTLTARESFLDVNKTHLNVDITARYLYGDPVLGTAYVVYGLKKENEKMMRAPKVKQVDMKNEGGTLTLSVAEITQACEVQSKKQEQSDCSIRSLVGSYVYIKASVLTESGGDLVEVEKSNIKIVKSPYVLSLKDIQKYFKPGLPFHFTIHVTYHDGRPAHRIPLSVSMYNHSLTSSYGTAGVSIDMPKGDRNQIIIVTTNDPNLSADRQATKEVTVEPYRAENPSRPNYLYIHSRSNKVELRELRLEMSITSEQKKNITEISYLILSKGKIFEAKRVEVKDQEITSITTTVTPEMMPSFRFVAFYILGTEVVSDSIKLKVSETCVNPPKISARDSKTTEYKPRSTLKLKIQGEPEATISLVAVDQAVYLLSKNRFTQKHILDEVDSRDFGCTAGSGKNPMGVFSDAGLLFAMKNGPSTESRKELTCQVDARRRRSTAQMEHHRQILGQFQDKSLQRCCRDGLRGVLMPYTCEQRSEYITEGPECIKAFLKCCNIYKKKVTSQRPDDHSLGRNEGTGASSDIPDQEENNALLELRKEDEEFDIDDIQLRTQFQDTWLWMHLPVPDKADLDGLGTLQIDQPIPDSITQWSILAVSSSAKTGFCVAEPWTFVAKQRFFVDLKLPFSVARNEQVEIKAVVYNYMDEILDVNVVLERTRDMCSVAFRRQHRQKVKVRPGSSAVVPYTIVPFKAGEITIQVAAYAPSVYVTDRVLKTLHVVVEGVQKTERKILPLNPSDYQDNRQVERISLPVLKGVVPNSVPVTKIHLLGNMLGDIIDKAIQDDPLANLIRMPGGCVEQNLALLTFPVIASLYLKRTKGWETVGVQRKNNARDYIEKGYSRQLIYQRSDGSYPPYGQRGPSTWVTAYVVKVFTMVYSFNSEIGNIDNICQSVNFLLQNKQSSDGSFTEDFPVSDQYITGGLRGSDSTATLTAFVTIALAEVRQANIECSYMGANTELALNKAVPYLKEQLQRSPPPRPYTTAIISYALALIGDGSAELTSRYLLAASQDGTHWPDGDSLFSLEATGYALLALVKMGKMAEAKKPFDYLRSNRNIGRYYGNTQSTMVLLHALSEYLIAQPSPGKRSLDVELQIAEPKPKENLNFNSETSYQLRSFNVPNNADLNVVAKGNGTGTVEVVTFYNQLPEEDAKSCETFDMQVSIKKSTEKPPPGIINVFELSISLKALRDVALSVVLDISLPTGFTVETKDLETLLNSVERFIDHFYFDDKLSDRSSLIIHLYKVSNTDTICVAFKLLQQFNVGLLQPSSVTVYEYYKEKGKSCTRLYSPPQDQRQLNTICRNYVCQCAQDDCCEIRTDDKGTDRKTFACKTLHHVFKVKVHNVSGDYYPEYDLEITNVTKEGIEPGVVESERRLFFSHPGCGDKCRLQKGFEYLIMGPERDRWTLDPTTNKYMYVLGKDTWVEQWPTEAECNDPAFHIKCQSIKKAVEDLFKEGCHAKK